MFKERKMLALLFLLFVIVASLMFSGIFSPIMEGMDAPGPDPDNGDDTTDNTTDDTTNEMTDEMMFNKLSNDKDTITLDDFTTILSEHPEIKELLKTKLSTMDSTSDETDIPVDTTTKDDSNNSSNTESFITRLTPSDYNYESSQLTPITAPTTTKAKSNKVFERTFEMSSQQPFSLQRP